MRKTEFTKEVYQNKIDKCDLEYDTEKHQPYFKFETNTGTCLIGLD